MQRAPRRSTRTAWRVRAFDHIAEVDAESWDSILPPGDLQASHRFIQACQNSGVENARYRHLMIYRGDRLEAIATLSVFQVSLELLSGAGTRTAIDYVRRMFPNFLRLRLVVCGLPVSFNRSCLRFRPGADLEPLLAQVVVAAEDLAVESDAPVVVFKEFDDDEVQSLASLQHFGYFQATSLPSCELPLPWKSFEGYTAALRAPYRRLLRRDLAQRSSQGLRVQVLEDPTHHLDRIFPLYEQVMDRAEFQLERLPPSFFEELIQNLRGEHRTILVEHGEDLLAAGILLSSPQETTFLLAGIDYERNAENRAYFNLVAEVVAEAIRRGAPRLELGQTSYDLKGRLGARFTSRHLFLKHRSGLVHPLLRATKHLLFPQLSPVARRVFKDA